MVSNLLAGMLFFSMEASGVLLVKANFDIEYSGNPYDSQQNDVKVEFLSKGEKIVRLAFFDGEVWRARLRSSGGLEFQIRALLNGKQAVLKRSEILVKEVVEPIGGIVRVSQDLPDRRPGFVDEAGESYFPLGTNLGWRNGGEPRLTNQLEEMSKAGMNWSRIWSNHWDGKNPFWVEGKEKLSEGWMYPSVLNLWDEIVFGAGRSGIRFQMVMFHHGPWSVDVNSNWNENPWNSANGGFLKEPREFFTNARAKQLSKEWLRYAVARYGHSGSILAWELFNEVEWTQPARQDNNWKVIDDWHAEMADYLRSIDPDRHMITTSSAEHMPVYEKLDYFQPHGYPVSVKALMRNSEPTSDRPYFYGEFGPGGQVSGSHLSAVRDGLWESVLRGHSGAACYWYWDRLGSENLFSEFKNVSEFLSNFKWVLQRFGGSISPEIATTNKAPLDLIPGIGWGKTGRFRIDLTSPKGAEGMKDVSAYFNSQKSGNKELFANPLDILLKLDKPAKFSITVNQVGPGGAEMQVFVNGVSRLNEKWQPDSVKSPQTFEIELKEGEQTLTIASNGSDWFQVSLMKVDGISPDVEISALAKRDGLVMRLTRKATSSNGFAKVSGLTLKNGVYKAIVLDLDTRKSNQKTVSIFNGAILNGVQMKGQDEIWGLTFVRI